VGITAALIIGGGFQVWNRSLRDQFFPKRFAIVEPGFLYRSGQIASRLVRDVLEQHSIDTVVSMRHYDERRAEQRAEKRATEELGIDQLNLHLRGNGTGDLESYAQALAAIHRAKVAGDQVLVHCAAGNRRSGAVIAAYQVLLEEKSPGVAFQELQRFADSDPVSESPIVPHLNQQMEPLAARLVEMGVMDRVPDPVPQFSLPESREGGPARGRVTQQLRRSSPRDTGPDDLG